MYATEMSNGKRAYVVRWKQNVRYGLNYFFKQNKSIYALHYAKKEKERLEMKSKKKLFQEKIQHIQINPDFVKDIE